MAGRCRQQQLPLLLQLLLLVQALRGAAATGPTGAASKYISWQHAHTLDPDRVALRDAPIAAESVHYLDGTWTAITLGDQELGTLPDTIKASVPGDIISDLYAAGRIGNPLYELNFKNHSLWTQDWTFSTVFDLPAGWAAGEPVLLVADGIKMGATVTLNGKSIGPQITDQFLRYTFDIGQVVRASSNTLSVAFDASIDCEGRWMACSGGWDW